MLSESFSKLGYRNFFTIATGFAPYPYQEALGEALGETSVLSVPTGCGKTQAVVVAWLWGRLRYGNVPRRLVYCLPSRVLTEQTQRVAQDCLDRLAKETKGGELPNIGIYSMMGGKVDSTWMDFPERSSILVGTQDILLSRALNRGYALSKFKWPVAFGLLHNDAFWVFDEVQLFGDGLATTTQLQAFRDRFQTLGPHGSLWMSATLDKAGFKTVDFDASRALAKTRSLGPEDFANEQIRTRLSAVKRLSEAPGSCSTPQGVAEFITSHHQNGTDTLVVANTVARAREIWGALRQTKPKATKRRAKAATETAVAAAEVSLFHSRFRPVERRRFRTIFESAPSGHGRILVATQVVEAGLDLDAALLVTDAAPLASLVQRFGRVNRSGRLADSSIYWVRRPTSSKTEKLATKPELSEKDKEELARPYGSTEVERAMILLKDLRSGASEDMPKDYDPLVPRHVLRKRDLLDLFDTAPDLAGNDLDISRFVREGSDHDVLVGWRRWADEAPPNDLAELEPEELCPVPVGEMKQFLNKDRPGWTWRVGDVREGDAKFSRERWEKVIAEEVFPGQTILLRCSAGGYTNDGGWEPESVADVQPVGTGEAADAMEGGDDDRLTFPRYRQSLTAHTDRVCAVLGGMLAELGTTAIAEYGESLAWSARHHDWGKAHAVFQRTLGNDDGSVLLAKQIKRGHHERRHFRHELASALAALQVGGSDLQAYLIASHHGRARLHIRQAPGERGFTLGIKEGESLPPADLGGGIAYPETVMSLGLTEMGLGHGGLPSWSDRMLGLLEELGPFRLGYLEAVLRAADWRASADPGEDSEWEKAAIHA